MNNDKIEPYEIASHKTLNIGRFTIVRDELRIEGNCYPYSYTMLSDSVCILPICENKIVLINEYRHSLKQWMWEFPAGAIEADETPEIAAKRELVEEAGDEAVKLRKIGVYPVSPGTSSLMTHLFVAECRKADKQRLEKTEFITVKEVCETQFEDMIKSHEFVFLAGIVIWDMYKRDLEIG